MDEDPFYALRTAYYIGDFAKVDQEYKALSNLSGMNAKVRDSYLCRSFIAQYRFKEASKLAKGEATPIVAAKQLLLFKQATTADTKEIVIDNLKEYLKEPECLKNTTFCVIASQVFIDNEMYREALELVVSNNGEDNLERLLQEIQIYLKIARPDLAQKSMQKMQELEDDDALTQIAQILLCLYHGGYQKVNDAQELLEDLISANNETIQLVNMQCVAAMHLKSWTEAYKLCKLSRDLAKKQKANNKHFEIPSATLINSITCLQHLNKGTEIIPKLMAELKRTHPDHQYLRDLEEMDALFDKSAKNFKL